ncbi:MAG: ATP-binding protein [Candidatus Heimdallarchaeota archaeon]|nr:ATP-binding protein [Candidatus Heimdallarchaeota archaeon]MDH5647063.1 ATP-binding protein [Candidatus Heimdallarchaeota archaeon]
MSEKGNILSKTIPPLLIILIVVNTIAIGVISDQQRNDATQLNVAGIQRMMIRDIELHVLQINLTHDQTYINDLEGDLVIFQSNHDDLHHGNKKRNIAPLRSETSIQKWEEIDLEWNILKTRLLEIKYSNYSLRTDDISFIHNQGEFIIGLQDDLVFILENESNNRHDTVFVISVILSLLIILIIVIIILQYRIISLKNLEITKSNTKLYTDQIRYQRLFDVSNDGIIVLNEQGTTIDYNQKILSLLGFDEVEILNNNIRNYWIKDNDKLDDLFHRFLNDQDLLEVDTIFQDKDGEHLYVSIKLISLMRNNQKVIYLIIQDNTDHILFEEEKIELTKQLFQTQKLEVMGRFAGEISHEINNLLTIVSGQLDLITLNLNDVDYVRKCVEDLREVVSTYSMMANRLLDLSKNKDTEQNLVNLGDITNNTMKLVRSIIPKSISFTYIDSNEYYPVFLNSGLYNQVLLNLINNSVDAMPNGGKLEIIVKKATIEDLNVFESIELPVNEYIMIKIIDSGEGINEELKGKIFESFFTTKSKGTGLGLSIVHNIITTFKGFITFISRKNFGTVFFIILPLQKL